MLSTCVRCGNPIFVEADAYRGITPPPVHRSCSCFPAPLTPRELHPSSGQFQRIVARDNPPYTINRTEDMTSRPETGVGEPSANQAFATYRKHLESEARQQLDHVQKMTEKIEGTTGIADYGDLIQMPREQFKFIKASRPTTSLEEFLQWGTTMPLTVEYPSSTDEAADL